MLKRGAQEGVLKRKCSRGDAKEGVLKRGYSRGIVKEGVLVRGWSGGRVLESLIGLDKDTVGVLGQANKQGYRQEANKQAS